MHVRAAERWLATCHTLLKHQWTIAVLEKWPVSSRLVG